MIWTADTVMYDGVSMDRAYSGSTLIWCKTCPMVITGYTLVTQGETLLGGEKYVIRNNVGSILQVDGTFSGGNPLYLIPDKNYPAVYEGNCEGFVTDLGAAFGLYKTQEPGRMLDYGYGFTQNKQSLSTFVGHDWQNPNATYKNDLIMVGQYGMQAYYSVDRGWEVGFNMFPLNGDPWYRLQLYHVDYGYQV